MRLVRVPGVRVERLRAGRTRYMDFQLGIATIMLRFGVDTMI